MAKAKEKSKPLAKDVALESLSSEELRAKLMEAKEERFRLQFRHANSPLKNPMELRYKRRDIARIKTWLTKKSKEVA